MSRLYLIGGASRAGKSNLAVRLLDKHRISNFCSDYLIASLQGAMPELGVHSEQAAVENDPKLWPFLKALMDNICSAENEYLVDGEALLPKNVYAYQSASEHEIRACFLGYTKTKIDEKLEAIRRNPSPVNDWSRHYADDALKEKIAKYIEFSHYIRDECEKFNLKYIDTSHNFEAALDEAENYLVKT